MRDTVEHELYMRNYVSEGVEQLEFSFDNAVESYGAQVRKQPVITVQEDILLWEVNCTNKPHIVKFIN